MAQCTQKLTQKVEFSVSVFSRYHPTVLQLILALQFLTTDVSGASKCSLYGVVEHLLQWL